MAVIVSIIFILAPLLFESLGIVGIHEYLPIFYLVIPLLLRFLMRKHIRFPIQATVIYGIFILSLLVTTFWFSVDKQVSFERTLFYTALFLIFIFFYNYRIDEEVVPYGLLWVAFVLTVYLVFLQVFNNLLPVPQIGYQMTFPVYGNHNHLGDLLGLVIISCLYLFFKQRKSVLLLFAVIAGPFFFFSHSRSAYIASLIVLLFIYFLEKGIRQTPLSRALIVFIGVGVMVFFIITTKETGITPIITQLHGTISEKLSLQPKDFFGGRLSYFQQSIESLYERPFFGLGLGNFEYASKKYAVGYFDETTDAHNIFLELGVEGGIFTLLPFMLFIFLILKKGLRSRSLFFYLFFYLLVNFQTDYTYKIYGLMALFMSLAGNLYSEEKEWTADWLFSLFSASCYLVFFAIVVSKLLLAFGEYTYSAMVYPLNKEAYQNKTITLQLAEKAEKIAPYHTSMISFLADYYSSLGEKQKALELLERLYYFNKFVPFDIVKKTFFLKNDIRPAREAEQFLREVLVGYNEISYMMNAKFRKELHAFCQEVRRTRCAEIN